MGRKLFLKKQCSNFIKFGEKKKQATYPGTQQTQQANYNENHTPAHLS